MLIYYGWVGGDFLFGSELKALRAHPRFDNPIEPSAVRLLLQRAYIPAPLSIYRRIFKLPPASILTLGAGELAPADEPPAGITPYWSYADVVRRGLADPIEDEVEALAELERSLAAAIAGQSVADVPVGAFLSGGIDSSTVVALYQKYSSNPVRTFSIGFEEAGYNEAEHAKAVAAHFGTVHHEAYVTAAEARDVIPLLPAMYDEPFADSSQIPTHLVSRHAREQVTVALTGDGGDELFGGYNRHRALPQLWQRAARLPRAVRAAAGSAIGMIPPALFNAALALAPGERHPELGAKLRKALHVAASARTFEETCRAFLADSSLGSGTGDAGVSFDFGPEEAPDAVRLMYCDAVSYLPDDILCKVDRASMAVALETRLPYLDHRVAEVAARIPLGMKIEGGSGKRILKKLLYAHAPRGLFERPKAGFAIPFGEWLKGPLRPWAEELLGPAAISSAGWLDPDAVSSLWSEHLAGRGDRSEPLWTALMLQAWLRDQKATAAVAA